MARYTCAYTISVSIDRLRQLMAEILMGSNLEILYNQSDYMMAREERGQLPFAKLVTVEVLIDKSTATDTETRMELVVKNEELPLQIDNHCHQVFNLISQAIADDRHWHLIESVAGQFAP